MKTTLKIRTVATLLVGLTVGIPLLPVAAQTVYRVVGADGKVTFSDQPPVKAGTATTQELGGNSVGTSSSALPFNLRQIATKFPVVLYSTDNCASCVAGRSLLVGRGIPFNEKTVTSREDAEALQRISGADSLPFVTIGGQQIKGYSDSEWTQFLDAAGYPKASVLPANYRPAAATPLVTVQKPVTPAGVKEQKIAPAVPPIPAPDTSKNPAGIQF